MVTHSDCMEELRQACRSVAQEAGQDESRTEWEERMKQLDDYEPTDEDIDAVCNQYWWQKL